MAQATDGHHTTLGELVPAQVSCWREVQSGGNPPPNTSEDGGRGLAASYKWAWAHIPCQTLQVGHGQVMKWVVDAVRTRGGGFPTSEEFLMSTDCADTYFLVDDIHPAKAGG